MGKKKSNLKRLVESVRKGAVILPKVKSPSPPPLFPPNHPFNRAGPSSTPRQQFVPLPTQSRKRKQRYDEVDTLDQMDDQHEGAFSVRRILRKNVLSIGVFMDFRLLLLEYSLKSL